MGLAEQDSLGKVAAVSVTDTRSAIDAVWRIESARLIAGLARIVRDVGVAEELAQDALVAALERWPQSGVPDNPGAWLMATAKHRAIDHFRRNKLLERKHEELGRELKSQQDMAMANFDTTNLDDDIEDDLLRLMFVSCHPVLSFAGWLDDPGNRAGFSCAGADRRPADCPGQADAHRGACSL
jgi:predicted RNA polymerase sigma factor